VQDDTAAQQAQRLLKQFWPSYLSGLHSKTTAILKTVFVEVRFKAVSGKEDQAGGLIWRAADANNYYVARANALEDNVCIYHTVNGRRTEKKRTDIKVAPNTWHVLRVEFQGNHFTVIFDGKKAIEWDDDTFKQARKVGVCDQGGQRDAVRRFPIWPELRQSPESSIGQGASVRQTACSMAAWKTYDPDCLRGLTFYVGQRCSACTSDGFPPSAGSRC